MRIKYPLQQALLWFFLACLPLITPGQSPEHFVHQDHSLQYGAQRFTTEAEWDQFNGTHPGQAKAPSGCQLNKAVYGWHPYWAGTAYNNYDFSLLSTFCYFSYEVNPSTGNYSSIHSWKTTPSVTLAQAAGCRVELCATLFGSANNTTFLTNPTAQQTFIDSIISVVQYRNADGVNIDFEGTPGAQRNNFTTFMQNLSNQLKSAIPGASLTMALYSVDWNNTFDIAALDPYLDQFIIMGYGYYYSGSTTAGPNAPLYSGSQWFAYNLTRSVLYYIGQGVTRSKLLIGLPYYGNEYMTTAGTVPSSATSFNGSRTYNYVKNNYDGTYTRYWDPISLTPAWIFQLTGQWRQAWVDDEISLGEKFDLVPHKNIGGIGIWALSYDDGYTELWDLIKEKFTDCGTPVCQDTLYDTGGPQGSYRNNEDYSWTIQSPNGQFVKASFPVFNVELNWDYLYVYDGPTTASPLIATLTGTTIPAPITSTGDALTFRFTSDNATVTPGFALAWECEGPRLYPDSIWLNTNDSATLNCNLSSHPFFDSDSVAGNYANNENNTMTFCVPDAGDAVRLHFDMQLAPVQLLLRSNTTGNDYLYIWDGPDTTSPLIGVYTGASSAYPQPGTIISTDRCLTVGFRSDAANNNLGWVGSLRCDVQAANLGTTYVSSSNIAPFEDTGGSGGNYANNEHYLKTFCPDATALLAGEVVWAEIGAIEIEENYDYLHVYDGPDATSRLICSYTGNSLDQNNLFTIKATEENPSGCLTFRFFSDAGATFSGWSGQMTSGAARKAFGTDHCADAPLITQANVPYAGSTTLATGKPNAEDPPLNISLISLTECSGANTITRLENSIWYKFTTPSSTCTSTQINFTLSNISCQNSIPGGNGAQFMLYEAAGCQTGGGWGAPIYCADKLLDSVPVNVAGLLSPSMDYYILIDGFAGQHCNFDLTLTGDIEGCILPLDLLSLEGKWQENFIQLNWETAQEQQNAGFWVQKGEFNPAGEMDFSDLDFVEATALPGQGATYGLPDFLADPNKINYYRLRQLDLDGASHFHKIIEILPKNGFSSGLVIYPNPARDRLHLGLEMQEAGLLRVSLFGLDGKLVFENEWQEVKGAISREINLEKVPSGMYIYQIQFAGRSLTGKLAVEK
ncbi:MAG: T9SS type A sorting domain-containing protein [Bacteroidia bacterium]|nr:T9SS type A sorting domain-containing protein [Bacteroidia bacterium]